LLVLDEPTNHLDVEAVAWLAAHVKNRVGALVVVTHDPSMGERAQRRVLMEDGAVRHDLRRNPEPT